jgi:hypothetical protein
MSQCWTPKPGVPDILVISTEDMLNAVREKWKNLGGVDELCPSPQYGLPGSPQHDACLRLAAAANKQIDEIFPELPEIGPYNSKFDAVLMEEVCQMRNTSNPNLEEPPFPNLMENPQAFAQALQKWVLESKAKELCQPCEATPDTGQCYCWPYFADATLELTLQGSGQKVTTTTSAPFWGPFYGSGIRISEDPDTGQFGYVAYVIGQRNQGSFINGNSGTCEAGTEEYIIASGSGYTGADFTTGPTVRPFTSADYNFYFSSGNSVGPIELGFCPTPQNPIAPPNMPNTRPLVMPNNPPTLIIQVDSPNGCPNDVAQYITNFYETPGAPGAPGEKGDKGDTGDNMSRVIKRIADERILHEINPSEGYRGGSFLLPRNIALVKIVWKSGAITQDSRGPRVFFQAPFGQSDRNEVGLGNLYLRHDRSGATLAPFMHTSMMNTLIKVPDLFIDEQWSVVVTDKYDLGFTIYDLGSYWDWARIQNPEDVPEIEYMAPSPF